MGAERVNWVDYGKGICIILVVMMHSTLNYGDMVGGTGWMHDVVAFAKPFRMPDFFLIAGLFLSRSIHGPLRDYIDRKVIHFAYFYILWLALQTLAFEADQILTDPAAVVIIFLKQLVFPASSLWFIHQLLVFYVVTRLVRNIPAVGVFAGACLLHVAFYAGAIETGWSVTDRFANWYVFFFAGYAFAPAVFAFARRATERWQIALAALLAWALWNHAIVSFGWGELPGVSLMLGFAGAFAIVTAAALLSHFNLGNALRYAGKHSIVIYLTFFIPMKVAQKGLAQTGLIPDIGTASLVVLTVAVVSPLILHRLIKGTPLIAIYERPAMFRLRKESPAKAKIANPAEA
ncbi:acyltransferase family protein [Henriciella sp.]|uniref:acyltransferase family protein n=1 Tax=Henriciella sp. TaxID=1968823 RepID=UPI0026135DAE|nr:acyltransferase family protein [Henriciella sp.]